MPATTKDKSSFKLFKVAAELNIGKETIAEYLKAKGFDIPVKPTTALTQEMYDLVMGKFEKEHRQIEKQRKKVDAYHERRSKTVKDEGEMPAEAPRKATRKATADEVPVAAEIPAVEAEAPTTVEEVPEALAEPVTPESMEPSIERPPVKVPEEEIPVLKPEEITPTAEIPDRQEAEIAQQQRAGDELVERSVPVEEVPEVIAAVESVEVAPPVEEVVPERKPKRGRARAPQTPAVEPVAEPEPVVETAPEAAPEVVEPATEVVEAEAAPPAEEAGAEQILAEGVEAGEGEAVADDDTPREFRGAAQRLQGLTVLGRIDLGTREQPDKEKKDRRPRKRIRESAKSVDITREQGTARTAATPSAPGLAVPPRTVGPAPGAGAAGAGDKRKKRGKGGFVPVDQQQVSRAIRQTFTSMGDSSKSSRQHRSRDRRMMREEREARRMEAEELRASVLQVTEFVTVAELAGLMNVDVGQVIGKCIGLGLMVSINQRLDKDTIQLVADEFGYSVEFQQDYAEDVLADREDEPEELAARAPIVTIMGHVDHGKTSLLDYIRNSNVVAGESGGITQHIGAYAVQLPDGRKITFLDTPGHEAFTAMRARGAQVTDIVILVVAADDAVMPQTVEAISHAQSAGVPMVIAINKVDKPESNVEKIKQQLSDRGVLVEEWGGKFQAVEVSAKKGINIDKLLETVLLEAEILDLKANPAREARGVIIEAEIDRGKGIVATVLVQKGTLRVGDDFVAGIYSGRVRALLDERGRRIEEAGPSEPAQVLGFSGVPTAGDTLVVLENEQDAREIATRRQQLHREQAFKQQRHLTLDEISSQIARGGVQHLPLIIKGDVDGSVEALADSLLRLSTPEVQVSVILKSVGEISESDVLLAAASQAIIIGFHVRPNLKARKLAEREGVEIRTYQIIYDTVNEVRAALEGMLRPEEKEEITGTVEIREVFKISRIGVVAGCYVADGKITRNDKIRLLRDGLEVWNGSVASLRRLKDDVREVEQGFECGVTLDGMSDVKVGDVIESYRMVEIKRRLEATASY